MPYANNNELPPAVKKRSTHAQDAFRAAFNAAHASGKSEEDSFKIAWSAAEAHKDYRQDAARLGLIRLRRATRPRIKRVPVQPHPDNIARSYARELAPLMREMHAMTMRALMPLFTRHDSEETRRLAENKVEVYRVITRARTGLIAQGVGKEVQRFAENAVGQQIKAVIAVNPLETLPALSNVILDEFAQRNAELISTVPARYLEEIGQVADESLAIGRRSEDVATLFEQRFEVSLFNATRIARDQVSKLNADVTEARHRDLGISFYFWRTSMDERVRQTHAAHEGQRYSYDNPPADTGNPGDDVQCRCRAEPDLSIFFD